MLLALPPVALAPPSSRSRPYSAAPPSQSPRPSSPEPHPPRPSHRPTRLAAVRSQALSWSWRQAVLSKIVPATYIWARCNERPRPRRHSPAWLPQTRLADKQIRYPCRADCRCCHSIKSALAWHCPRSHRPEHRPLPLAVGETATGRRRLESPPAGADRDGLPVHAGASARPKRR